MRKRAIAALAAGGVALGLAIPGCAAMNQMWHSNCVVKAKHEIYEIREGNSQRNRRVDTSCGTFAVNDALEVGHFNSWDLWAALEEGKMYDLKTGGHRIGFFSTFPTLLEVKPLG